MGLGFSRVDVLINGNCACKVKRMKDAFEETWVVEKRYKPDQKSTYFLDDGVNFHVSATGEVSAEGLLESDLHVRRATELGSRFRRRVFILHSFHRYLLSLSVLP